VTVIDQISSVENHRLDPAELAALRDSLEKHRLFRRDQLREIALTTTSRGDRASPEDAVAQTEIRHQLATTARMVLAEIDAAVLRMDNSEYGKCDRCGDPLAIQRLRIHPQTRYCMRCQYAMETTRGRPHPRLPGPRPAR
jgi:DnaK suppressor protein